MTNMLKLKGKIVEKNFTVEQVAKTLEMNPSTFYRKLANDGETFTIAEANKLGHLLNLSVYELNEIFFTQLIADVRI